MTRRVAPAPPGVPALEPVRQDLYDTKAWEPATSSAEFFRNPGIGEINTNMQANGQLPFPQQYHVFGLCLEVIPNYEDPNEVGTTTLNSANKKKLLEQLYLRFRIGSKDYLTVPMKRVPTGLSPFGYAGGNISQRLVYGNGLQDVQQYYDVTIRQGGKIKPIHIPAQQSFFVQVVNPFGAFPVTNAWLFRCYLVGILWREVQ